MIYEIDGERFSSLAGFYDEVGRVMLIPGTPWGRNQDAFNDILNGAFGEPPGGFTIVWKHSGVSAGRLGHTETARSLELALSRCHETQRETALTALKNARDGKGPTIFNRLVDLIREHQHVELRLE